MALPKGRILSDVHPFLKATGIEAEQAFHDNQTRKLAFKTNIENFDLIKVRSFDVATLVAFGAAHLGIVGSDVIMEHQYDECFSPVNLNIGQCRLVVAKMAHENFKHSTQLRVATKYPNLTRRHFHSRNIQIQTIKLHGAIELAPLLGICDYIVDLVSTGRTLKANHLVEVETISEVSSYLIVNRNSARAIPDLINPWIKRFEEQTSQNGF
ncbi:MAG: ATP phosphoribosyltransferase [Pseudomonadota bacterium]